VRKWLYSQGIVILLSLLAIVPEGMSETNYEGTIGTRFTIQGEGFGDTKGEVYIEYEKSPGNIQKLKSKNENWNNVSITCLWTKKLSPGIYNLFVKPKNKGINPINVGTFNMKSPVIDSVSHNIAFSDATITIQGKYFSSKKPNIYIEDKSSAVRKKCKVTNSFMNPETGESSVQFVVPKLNFDSSNQFNITLQNIILQNQIAEVVFTKEDTTPPTPPQNLTLAMESKTQLKLSWYAATDDIAVKGYKIYRNNAYIKSVTNTTATEDSLSAKTKYCYTITAYDGAGNESVNSNEECAGFAGWQTYTIDFGTGKSIYKFGVGRATSIAVDYNNKIHISYFSDDDNSLKYTSNVSGSWSSYQIDNNMECLPNSSIAIDGANKIHISYNKCMGNMYVEPNVVGCDYNLYYTNNIGGSWVTIPVETEGSIGSYNSLAIDSKGNMHISYHDSLKKDLKYATNKNGLWETYTIDTAYATHTNIAIDSNDKVHISYMNHSTYDLKYATNSSGTWETYTLDSKSGWDNDIAVDSNNKIHISHFTEEPTFALKYTTNVTGEWVTHILSYKIAWFTALALDSANNVHISYFNNRSYDLEYITNVNDTWEEYLVDGYSLYDFGRYNDIALDRSDNVHISYWYSNYNNGSLMYTTGNVKK
jgi:hypothetical protein